LQQQRDHLFGSGHLHGAQPVQKVLQYMGKAHQVGEREGSRAAFDGVRGAEDRIHQLDIIGSRA
jgi:hypothetical protein